MPFAGMHTAIGLFVVCEHAVVTDKGSCVKNGIETHDLWHILHFLSLYLYIEEMKCIRFIITTTAHQLYSHVLQYAFAIVDQALIAISI